jgi:FkbH-like protein
LSGLLHSHSILKQDDFAAVECSWDDKVKGLKRIARSLKLSLDSLVFVDDDPAECDLIRRSLPDVTVVHLGSDPASFIDRLDAGCWFDLQNYTTEDFERAEAYALPGVAMAEQPPEDSTEIGAFLTSLEMEGRLYEPGESDIARIVQLEQKTNQFNLTTRRYSDTAIQDFLKRGDVILLAFRLADRFGKHGLVSVIIGVQEQEKLRIDSWTMSCRVFSRSAEQFIMLGLIGLAKKRGITNIEGVYEPTKKNGVVADLYVRLGFNPSPERNVWLRSMDRETDDLVTYIKNTDGGKPLSRLFDKETRRSGKIPSAVSVSSLWSLHYLLQSLQSMA